jgi:hypothetical protein
MKSFSSMVPTAPEYQQGPLVAPYMSSMSHKCGVVVKLGGELKPKPKTSTPNVGEGGVGGLNHTPCLMKSLVIMSLSFESYVTFVMNPKP